MQHIDRSVRKSGGKTGQRLLCGKPPGQVRVGKGLPDIIHALLLHQIDVPLVQLLKGRRIIGHRIIAADNLRNPLLGLEQFPDECVIGKTRGIYMIVAVAADRVSLSCHPSHNSCGIIDKAVVQILIDRHKEGGLHALRRENVHQAVCVARLRRERKGQVQGVASRRPAVSRIRIHRDSPCELRARHRLRKLRGRRLKIVRLGFGCCRRGRFPRCRGRSRRRLARCFLGAPVVRFLLFYFLRFLFGRLFFSAAFRFLGACLLVLLLFRGRLRRFRRGRIKRFLIGRGLALRLFRPEPLRDQHGRQRRYRHDENACDDHIIIFSFHTRFVYPSSDHLK